jgi:hypothetical protein
MPFGYKMLILENKARERLKGRRMNEDGEGEKKGRDASGFQLAVRSERRGKKESCLVQIGC